MSGFFLGRRSKDNLSGVHPRLRLAAEHAITVTEVDFTIIDGVRTMARQREYLRRGVSQTLRSKHLIQRDGYGHALDIVPWIDGEIRWELEPCCRIAEAMHEGAVQAGLEIRWGGAWSILDGTKPEDLVDAYYTRKRANGSRVFIDGPHYEVFRVV